MKNLISIFLCIILCFGMCACNSSKETTGTSGGTIGTNDTQYETIEEKAVYVAIKDWVKNNPNMLNCEDFQFTISSNERNDMITRKDDASYQYYNTKGNVYFFDKYNNLIRKATFTVVYAYNFETFYVSDTIIE